MSSLTREISIGTNDGCVFVTGSVFSIDNVDVGRLSPEDTSIHSFLLFENITIPQGSSTPAATLSLLAEETDNAAFENGNRSRIYANKVGNATAPTSYADFFTKTLTTAYVDWEHPLWTAGVTYTSPDFNLVIQEVVNQSSWASGNSLMILLYDNDSDIAGGAWDNRRSARDKGGDPGFQAAQIDITYFVSPLGGGHGMALVGKAKTI